MAAAFLLIGGAFMAFRGAQLMAWTALGETMMRPTRSEYMIAAVGFTIGVVTFGVGVLAILAALEVIG